MVNNSINFLNQLKKLLPNAHFALDKTKIKSDLIKHHNLVFKFKVSQEPIKIDLSSITQPSSSAIFSQTHYFGH
jgi:hypothetical protein